MKVLSVFATFSALCVAVQVPLQEDPILDVKRVIDCSGKKQWICGGGRAFMKQDITNAGEATIQHQGQPVGRQPTRDRPNPRRYPHEFFNHETITFEKECRSNSARNITLVEYPILHTLTFPEFKEESDRAIFTFVGAGAGNIIFCGVVRHTDRGGFVPCGN